MSLIDLGFTLEEAQKETKGDFEQLPEGTYDVSIVDIAPRTGKDSGNPYLNIQLSIVNHPTLSNRRIFDIIMLDGSPMAKRKTVEMVTGLGETWTGSGLDTSILIGRTGTVKYVYRRDKTTKEVLLRNDGEAQTNVYWVRR